MSELKHDVRLILKALRVKDDHTVNYRFRTWGEFNSTYLMFLSESEKAHYDHLALKFALIHEYYKKGSVPSIHGDMEGFQAKIDKQLMELEKSVLR